MAVAWRRPLSSCDPVGMPGWYHRKRSKSACLRLAPRGQAASRGRPLAFHSSSGVSATPAPLLQNHPPQSAPHPDDQVWALPAPDFLRPHGAWVCSRKVPKHGQQVRLELSQYPAPSGPTSLMPDEQGGARFQLLAAVALLTWKRTEEYRPQVSHLHAANTLT